MTHQNIILSLSLMILVCCSQASGPAPKPVSDNSSMETVQQQNPVVPPVPDALVADEDNYELKPIDPKDLVSPMQSIKNLDKKIEDYSLGKELTAEQLEANKNLKKEIIRGTFDISELCRLSLGKHWHEISKEQQKIFVGLMTTLLETKAIFSKEQLKGSNKLYRIEYSHEKYDDPEKKKATVYSKMHVPKEKMTLDITYKLLLTPSGWRIFDVIVDDASLLSNYKFQFDRIITKSGFDDLISRMNQKLEKIKEE